MSFLIALILGVLAAALYFNGTGWPLQTFCRSSLDLCQHPQWFLYGALAFLAAGVLFRLNEL